MADMTSPKLAPWKMIAKAPPINVPVNKAGSAGSFKITMAITETGANKRIGDKVLKFETNVSLMMLI